MCFVRGNRWIKVWSELAETSFWLSEPFTRAQAWMDLQFMACSIWDQENHPGDVKCSLRFLSRRWQWSMDKVKLFLTRLDQQGWISFSPDQAENRTGSRTLLHLVNYGLEQGRPPQKSDKTAEKRSAFQTENRTDFQPASSLAKTGAEPYSRPANRTGSRTKSRQQEENIFEEYRRPCLAAEAPGAAEKKIPAEYRDRFATWEEYISWRYQ